MAGKTLKEIFDPKTMDELEIPAWWVEGILVELDKLVIDVIGEDESPVDGKYYPAAEATRDKLRQEQRQRYQERRGK